MIKKHFFATIFCLTVVFSGKSQLNIDSLVTAQYRRHVRFLQSQPFVEGSKIGFYGCSYGGTTAMFVPPNFPFLTHALPFLNKCLKKQILKI
jgi:dienelactone hydrolase